jgi:sulfate permease, SulP family
MTLQPWNVWRSLVNRRTLTKDASAGLTGALIVLPQAMAYAIIAGLPPQYGLYCAIVPAIIAALFGSSWHLVSGPTAAISIVIFATLSPMAKAGSDQYILLALTLTFLVGVIQLMMALLRLGKLTDKIPHSVIIGFTTGAAFLIAASQIKHFFGLTLPTDNSFSATLMNAISAAPTMKWQVAAVGTITLLVTVAAKAWMKPIPHMVVGMVAGALTAFALGSDSVKLVGSLPSALPQLSTPAWDISVWLSLSKGAVVVALLALTEAIAIARAVGLRSKQTIDGNQETFGQGLSNVAGAFFSGYASSGSFTRSGVNYEAGAKTPLAAVFAAIILMVLLLLISPLLSYLPIAAMAGILFIVAWGLIDKKEIKHCFTRKTDAAIFLTTFLACLITNIEIAVFAGIALSIILRMINKNDHNHVHH